MAKVWTFKFSVQHERQKPDEFLVDSVRAVAGTGAHCEIRLRDAAAAPEQVVFEAREGGVFARVLSAEPEVLLDGAPFSEGRILPESRVEVLSTQIRVELVETDFDQVPRNRRKKEPKSFVIYALGCVGFPLGFYVILSAPEGVAAVDTPSQPPSLFASAAPHCPQTSSAEARAVSENELVMAESKRERSPFHPEDGVAAATHYDLAAACLRTAGDHSSSLLVLQKSEALKRKLNAEFHVHRARLDYALSTEQYQRARGEVRTLLAFVAENPSEYTTRLSRLDRRLELQHSGKKETTP